MKRVSLLATLALACAFTSCKKDNEKPKSKSEILTSREWMISAATATVAGQSIDLMNNPVMGFDACEKDNVYAFASAGTYAVSEGATACSPSSAESGTWSLNSDATKLTITPQGGSAEVGDVAELSDNTLKVSGTDNSFGTPMTITITYRKK